MRFFYNVYQKHQFLDSFTILITGSALLVMTYMYISLSFFLNKTFVTLIFPYLDHINLLDYIAFMSLLHMVTAECNAWFPSGTLVKVAKRWMFLIDRGNIFLFNVTRSEFWESSHWILNCASNNVLSCHVFGKLKWLNLLDHAPNKNWNSDYDGCSNHSERKSKYYIFLIVLEGFLWGFF